MTSPAAPALLAALDAEWAAQSERTRPLVATPFVREALELAVVGSPEGIFALHGRMEAETPDSLVRRVEALLPAVPEPWTLRLLGRLRSLPAPPERPRLESPEEEASETEPARLELTSPVVLEPAPTAPPPPRRRWMVAALVSGTAGGVAVAVAAWLGGTGG